MRLALTADLHWGHTAAGDAATRAIVERLAELQTDGLVIAGDVGTGPHFSACLEHFAGIPGERMLVPGNHDLWTVDPAPASLDLWERELPRIAAEHGFRCLDAEPYVSPDGTEAVVGSINWYDYSLADPQVEVVYPRAREMYAAKLFPNARHNDGRFVRLGMSDDAFTERVVERFRAQLTGLPESVNKVTVVQHHPPIRELFFPAAPDDGPIERRFWLAYTGNRRMQ